MKKNYIQPSVRAVELYGEDMVANITISSGGKSYDDKQDAWTNKKDGWSSESWTEKGGWAAEPDGE